jgi:hypothetical protein
MKMQTLKRAGRFCLPSALLLLGGAATLVFVNNDRGQLAAQPPPAAAESRTYDPDPAHLWNRLHAALFIRTAKDGRPYGDDELDPLLWPHSKYLLAGERHKQVVALLDEFIANDGHKLIKDPLRRTIFQRDLWSVFDWLANPTAPYGYRHDDTTPEARALQVRMATIIRRLALTNDEIQQLPDNYAAAVRAKAFAAIHNPQKPEQAFLPSDLFDPEGPWVLLGEHMRPAAPMHVKFTHGRAAFFVFLNLPAGRKASLEYLGKLGAFPNPLMPQPADRNSAFLAKRLPFLNPALPQFPVGTQVALAREMLTVDDKGKVRPTRIIESAQFRVYREIPKGDPANPAGFDDLAGKQDFYEFRMTRKDLFAGKNGGLHAVGPQEEEMNLFIAPAPHDPFEDGERRNPGTSRIMQVCSGCHRPPGIHSVEAYRRSFIQLPRPPHLEKYDRAQQETAVMMQKWDNYSWGLLQGLMDQK